MLIGHGGDIYSAARALGCNPGDILDFSSNVSHLAFKKDLVELLKGSIQEIRHLPEPDSLGLRRCLQKRYAIDESSFLVGNGTTQWIYEIPRVLRFKRAMIPTPTYSDYEDAVDLSRRDIHFLGPFLNGTKKTSEILLRALHEEVMPGDLVFLCNPNNPTGLYLKPRAISGLVSAKKDAFFVIDESYAPFVGKDHETSLLAYGIPGNCVVLRSFSKIYGIPGLRIGYMAGPKRIIEAFRVHQRPWGVGRLAQIAAEYLLKHQDLEDHARDYAKKERERITSWLSRSPSLKPLEGRAHFILIEVLPPFSAAQIHEKLLEEKILVRNCKNFRGLERYEYIRISPRTSQDNQRLLECLGSILG